MRAFLLSPASCRGKRTEMLLNPAARFDLARALRGAGAPLGEVFAFLSGLYFRGKLAYARAFAGPNSTWVITPGRGLLSPETNIRAEDLLAFAAIDVDLDEPRYREPLAEDARRLARRRGLGEAVLLGSIATDKYVGVLRGPLGRRLVFPAAFVGRGDMSRGGLMLRAARAGTELEYVPLEQAARHGPRPARLARER